MILYLKVRKMYECTKNSDFTAKRHKTKNAEKALKYQENHKN